LGQLEPNCRQAVLFPAIGRLAVEQPVELRVLVVQDQVAVLERVVVLPVIGLKEDSSPVAVVLYSEPMELDPVGVRKHAPAQDARKKRYQK
jgi:hypothetical protein